MKQQLLAISLLASACAEPDTDTDTGRSDTLRWWVWDNQTRPSTELLDEVESILGFELVESESPIGATTLVLGSETGDDRSNFGVGFSCTPFIYIDDHVPIVLAHEFGHAYGLGHNDLPDNLMGPSPQPNLTNEQIDEMRESAWISEEYCQP